MSEAESKAKPQYSRNTQRAIDQYGEDTCLEAFRLHDKDGEGARTVAIYMGGNRLTTNQADAAINAGREIIAHQG